MKKVVFPWLILIGTEIGTPTSTRDFLLDNLIYGNNAGRAGVIVVPLQVRYIHIENIHFFFLGSPSLHLFLDYKWR
jgi:hypothetical protein